MEAMIFDIKRFAVHDGDGIRTTVFFKGCPLRCIWCHNPEGLSGKPALSFTEHKCVFCGRCASVCPCHIISNGKHIFRRENCTACGKCVPSCPADALCVYGKKISEEELLKILIEDRDFYETSGGGITLSGGECLLQAEFCARLLKRCKEENLRTAVDTCGFVPFESLLAVKPYTDRFLYDVKAFDEEVHTRCTGVSNRLILENLKKLDESGAKIEIRIPFVPDCNDTEIEKIGEFLAGLSNVVGVHVLAYHNLAAAKYRALGLPDTLPKILPEKDALSRAEETMRGKGLTVF